MGQEFQARSIRLVGLLVLTQACYGPNPDYIGAFADEGATTGGPGESGDSPGSDESNDLDGTGNISSSGDSSDPDNPSCADGNPESGEICFTVSTLLALPVQSLAAGDFDSDGHIDLGVAGKDDVRILFGDGSGGFPLQLDPPEADGDYWSASVGDLDDNGHPDLVLGNYSTDTLVIYASAGDKSFAAPLSFATGDQPAGLALAQVDEDARIDVVVANKGSDTASVLINQGLGVLAGPLDYPTKGDEPRHLVLGHFDPDATLDLAIANRNSKNLSILLGANGGSFAMAKVEPLAGRPYGIVTHDFNLDGALDLALALGDEDAVEIMWGEGLGGFADHVVLPVGNKPVAIAVIDLDIDGALDLVVLNRDDANVGVLFGDADLPGHFLAQQTLVGLSGFVGLTAILVADLNDDGVDDLVVGGSELRMLLSNP